VLNAIRERQTVVYDRGQYYGDDQLIQLLKSQGPPSVIDPFVRSEPAWVYFSRIAGSIGLLLVILIGPRVFRWRN
jgi:hypothetical protein